MFFKETIRQAFINRRWAILIIFSLLSAIILVIYAIVEDRLANWANSKIDTELPKAMNAFYSFVSSDIFPVIAWVMLVGLAIIGFIILYRRVGREPRTQESNKGIAERAQPRVAAQMVAKAILDQQNNTQQLEEWWEQYRPSCEIVKVNHLEISKSGDGHLFYLTIHVKYTSRDPRYSTRMDCTTILLDVFHTGKDRDQRPHRLHSIGQLYIVPHGLRKGYRPIEPKWDLPSNTSWVVIYHFIGQIEGEPLIENETSCKILDIGIPQIKNVPLVKPIIIEDSKFPIAVDDGRFSVKIDKQN